jgi:ATP phosphoribosyltransferase
LCAAQGPQVDTLFGACTACDWPSYVLVDYDIRTEHLEQACSLTPGIESPTVSSLHDPLWSAVRAMVPSLDVHRIMDELYDLGARGILVTDIHACRL